MVRREVKLHVQALIAAFQFLTRIPVPVTVPFAGPVLARSVIYFPLAGALIGVCLAAFAMVIRHVCSCVRPALFWCSPYGRH